MTQLMYRGKCRKEGAGEDWRSLMPLREGAGCGTATTQNGGMSIGFWSERPDQRPETSEVGGEVGHMGRSRRW